MVCRLPITSRSGERSRIAGNSSQSRHCISCVVTRLKRFIVSVAPQRPIQRIQRGWARVLKIPTHRDAELLHMQVLRLLVIFVLVFSVLQVGYQAGRGTVVEKAAIDIATVKPSVWLINRLNPQESVQARGSSLVSPQVRLSVLSGCEGTESMFLIVAAIAAFRSSWRHKLVGLTLGVLLIYLANQARIVGLYFALRHDRELFAALHGYIAPTLIIAVGFLFYLWWMQWVQSRSPALKHSPAV